MKRLLPVILALLLALTGCAKSKPKDMPQDVYDQGARVVNVIDEYYKGTTTLDQVKSVRDEAADYVSKQWSSSLPVNEQLQITKVNNCLISMANALNSFEYGQLINKDPDAASEELKKAQKELKKALNM